MVKNDLTFYSAKGGFLIVISMIVSCLKKKYNRFISSVRKSTWLPATCNLYIILGMVKLVIFF